VVTVGVVWRREKIPVISVLKMFPTSHLKLKQIILVRV
jgi:hypothetical protein